MRTELLEKYIESLPQPAKRPYGAVAERYLRWLKDREPSKETVEKYLKSMSGGDEPYSQGTIHKTFDILRRLFVVNGLEWPFRRHEAPVVSERDVWAPGLGTEVIKSMVDVCQGRVPSKNGQPGPDHRAYLILSTIWGLRRVEMMEISPDSLDFKNKLFFVQTVKRGRQRYHMIPDLVAPYLEEYGFSYRKSASGLSIMFNELQAMVGLTAREMGWHAIRRSLTRQLSRSGFDEAAIFTFLRWKRSNFDMAMRYATSSVVGFEGAAKELSTSDTEVDTAILAKHPFLSFWGDKKCQKEQESRGAQRSPKKRSSR